MEEPSPTVQDSGHVSVCRLQSFKVCISATSAAALWAPVSYLVPISLLEMLFTVTPSCPIWTPTLGKIPQTTSSMASWWSIAVGQSIGIFDVQPPSECASTLAVIHVYSGANMMACLVRIHLFRSCWVCRANSWMLWKSMLILQLIVYPRWLPPCASMLSWAISRTCHTQLQLSNNLITVHSLTGIWHINWTSSVRYIHMESTCLLRVPWWWILQ